MNRLTDTQTYIWTNRTIESNVPEGLCIDNPAYGRQKNLSPNAESSNDTKKNAASKAKFAGNNLFLRQFYTLQEKKVFKSETISLRYLSPMFPEI